MSACQPVSLRASQYTVSMDKSVSDKSEPLMNLTVGAVGRPFYENQRRQSDSPDFLDFVASKNVKKATEHPHVNNSEATTGQESLWTFVHAPLWPGRSPHIKHALISLLKDMARS